MKRVKVEIKESSIEGFGAFTKEIIKKGELVTLERDPKVFPDGEDASWIYVNHRCKNPNLTVEIVDGKRSITRNRFRAIRDVQIREELTTNYQSLDWQCHFIAIMEKGCKCPDCVTNKKAVR